MIRSWLLSFFLFTFCRSQFLPVAFPEETLAIIDQHCITTRDLYERISLMPYEDKITERDFESVKRKGVESIVGEYLLAVAELPPDSAEWRKSITASVLEKLFVRDALYKREIRQRVQISYSELLNAVQHYAVRRRVLMIKIPEGKKGIAAVKEWRLARKRGNAVALARYQYDTISVSLGSIDSVFESAAFRLKDTLDVIGPVQSQLFGPAAISLLNDEPNPDAAGKSVSERRKAVFDILVERKESQLMAEYLERILRGQRMEAEPGLYKEVGKKFRELMLQDTSLRKVAEGYRYLPDDIHSLLYDFRAKLDSPIVRGTFGALKLGEFLEHLLYFDLSFPSIRARQFAAAFFQMLKIVAEAEMAAQEAYRRGLKYDPEVRRDVLVWMNYDRSRKAEFVIADTVVLREWEPYWSLWQNEPGIVEKNLCFSVQEILLDDSSLAVHLKKQIEQGASMDSLVKNYTLRKEWKSNGGRSGWFAFNEYPDIARTVLMSSIGDDTGPVKLSKQFSLLRLLGRKFAGDTLLPDSLLRREFVRLRARNQLAAVSRYIASSALNHRVEIYYDRIKRADAADINMITRRLIGFGGKINAAPFLQPQWKWAEEWKKLRRQIP